MKSMANESPLKIMKNAFYFTLKVFSFSRYLTFCLDFLITQKNGLIRKIRSATKFMTSQPRKQTIAIHILQYISRNKDKQTMKFGQLIECNMRNIFFQKSYIKCAGDTSPRQFSKKSKLSISLDQQPRVLQSLFLLYAKLRAIEVY